MRLLLPVALAAASALFLAAPPARGQEFAYGYTYLWADDDGVDLEGYSTTTNNYGIYWVSVVVCAQIYDPSGEPLGDPQEDDEDGTGMDAYVSLFAEADGPGEYEAIGNHWFYGDYDGDADPPETYATAFVNQTPSVSDVDIDGVDYQNAPSGLDFAAGSNNTITFDGVDLGGETPTITGCGTDWSITGWANTESSVSTTLTVWQNFGLPCMIEIAVAAYPQIGIALSPPPPPTIFGPCCVWWFNGYNPANYNTSITLSSTGGPSTIWAITQGQAEINLVGNGTTATVTSTGFDFSEAVGDILVTATANGQASAPFHLTTQRPYQLVSGGNPQFSCDSTFGYAIVFPYIVQDNLGIQLPVTVPVNEFWSTAVVPDYPGNNWTRIGASGFTANSAQFGDEVQGQGINNAFPVPYCNSFDDNPVQHWGQQWYVGDVHSGNGVLVQNDTIQKFQGTATEQ
jgi:hypothetical protein